MIKSTCELVAEIQPGLPEGYKRLTEIEAQAAVDGQRNLLQMRRNLVELISGQRIQLGEIEQFEADAEALKARLAQNKQLPPDKKLPGHRVRHIHGRRAVCLARAERGRELIAQYDLEINLYRQILEAS